MRPGGFSGPSEMCIAAFTAGALVGRPLAWKGREEHDRTSNDE